MKTSNHIKMALLALTAAAPMALYAEDAVMPMAMPNANTTMPMANPDCAMMKGGMMQGGMMKGGMMGMGGMKGMMMQDLTPAQIAAHQQLMLANMQAEYDKLATPEEKAQFIKNLELRQQKMVEMQKMHTKVMDDFIKANRK